jgi:hypothetical protein
MRRVANVLIRIVLLAIPVLAALIPIAAAAGPGGYRP